MQSDATGQALGELHMEYRELDLDKAAETSGRSKDDALPGGQRDRGLEQLLMCLWGSWAAL